MVQMMLRLGRAAAASRAAIRHPLSYARAAARLPLEQKAAARIACKPTLELAQLLKGESTFTVRIPSAKHRHEWSLGATEQIVLQTLIQARNCRTAFEIGTFNGGTTRVIAEALPDEGHVWTLDLPPRQFDASQQVDRFSGDEIGVAFQDEPVGAKITQIRGDSLEFDFSPFERCADLVLVDGGHEYEHGLSDTQAALRIVRFGGVVLWDDFEPYWHGLVNGICDAMGSRHFGRLAGTTLAAYLHD